MKNTISIITILAIEAFLGIMINIGLSYLVRWQSMEPIEFMESFKVDYPLLMVSIAVTLLPAFLGCLCMALCYPKHSDAKKYWRYALICILFIILQTLIFHLPKNLNFMEHNYTALEASGNLDAWTVSHWIRVGVALMAGIFAIIGYKKAIESSIV